MMCVFFGISVITCSLVSWTAGVHAIAGEKLWPPVLSGLSTDCEEMTCLQNKIKDASHVTRGYCLLGFEVNHLDINHMQNQFIRRHPELGQQTSNRPNLLKMSS